MKKKTRIAILFGGRSGEHEVSLLSAASVLQAIDRSKYDVTPLAIDKQGRWLGSDAAQALLPGAPPASGKILPQLSAGADLVQQSKALAESLDVIFPILHGTFGEDGTIQGFFELADLAYVGSGVLGSAAGMDKDVMKRLFAAARLPQTAHVSLLRTEWRAHPLACRKRIESALLYPLFVKPANLGSSVGISKVKHRRELAAALDLAAGFDRKLVIEQGVGGPGAKPRELEVAVLGNDAPQASVVGEIVPNKEFYDYESKYADSPENPSLPIIPARISAAESKKIRQMAISAFQACDCSGLARVDFLMEPGPPPTRLHPNPSRRIFLNEINTMPGFTSISMYPKLWEASGIPYPDLIDRLITLALERHAERRDTAFTWNQP